MKAFITNLVCTWAAALLVVGGTWVSRADGDSGTLDIVQRPVARTDAERYQGRWKLVEIRRAFPQPVTDPRAIGDMHVKGNKYRLKLAAFGQTVDDDYTFKIFPKKEPKAFNVTIPDGRVMQGIYKMDGDTLHRAYSQPGTPRPASFKAPGSTYQKWRRVPQARTLPVTEKSR